MPTKKKAATKVPSIRKFRKCIDLYNERIDAGVRFLDRKIGRLEWLAKVDERMLKLDSPRMCMCGQVFGDYWTAVAQFEWKKGTRGESESESHIRRSAALGFNTDPEMEKAAYLAGASAFDILTRLWFNRVSELRLESTGLVLTPPPAN